MATIIGNNRSNLLFGTNSADTISGRGGNDVLIGRGGDDSIYGGDGSDRIDGGRGNDFIDGGSGSDRIDGGRGNDVIGGGSGNDTIDGGSGNDRILGGAGNDRIDGGSGNDVVDGGTGNDLLSGGSGDDTLIGGAGADQLTGGSGSDRFVFLSASDSPAASGWDRITDFTQGRDKIDLTAFPGSHDLNWSGTTAGIRYGVWFDHSGTGTSLNSTFVYADTNGDGTADLKFELRNTSGLTLTSSDFIGVAGAQVNHAPVITSHGGSDTAALSIAESTKPVNTVTVSDPDAGDTRNFSISGGADQGLFAIDGLGNLTMAAQNFVAGGDNTYDVIVKVTDSGGLFDTQAITVTVTDTNDVAPAITTAGAQSVDENAAFSVALTSTDVDTVGTNPAIFTITGGADQGLFAIDGLGNLTMAAKNFEVPTDSNTNNTYVVQVTANDGANTTNKTITVTVNDQNDVAPTITSGASGSEAEGTATSNVVYDANATDPDTVGTVSFSLTGTDAGQFDIDSATGAVTFKVSPDFELPADTGGNNVYDVVVHANDGVHDTTQAVTIAVTDVNDAPVANSAPVVANTDVTGAVTELVTPVGNLTDSGTIAFTDADLADIHSVSAVTPSAGALGSLTASVSTDTTGSGVGGVVTWNYSVAAANVEFLAAGQHLIETFTFDVLDGQGGSVSRTISVDITGTNDAAVLSAATINLDETDAVLSTGGTLTISDVDSDQSFVAQTAEGNFGTFSIDTAGVWSYTAGSAFDDLNVNDSVSDTFIVKSADDTPTSVQVTITGTNDAAVLSAATINLDETDAVLSTGGTLTISDVDSDQSFVAQTAEGNFGTFSIDTAGVWSYTAGSAFDDLNVNDSVSDTFIVKSADDTPTSVQVTITGTNDAAVLSAATINLDETDAVLSTGGTLTISDVDSDQSFVAQTAEGNFGTFSIDTAGVWTYTAGSAFDDLNVNDSVSDTFIVKSADDTPTSVQVTITGTNDAAVLSAATSQRWMRPMRRSRPAGTLTISDVDSDRDASSRRPTRRATIGTFSIDTAGAWTYTAGSAFDDLNVATASATPSR